jgi:hypothetical protein
MMRPGIEQFRLCGNFPQLSRTVFEQASLDEKFRQNHAEYLSLPYDDQHLFQATGISSHAYHPAGRMLLRSGIPVNENNSVSMI